MTGINDVPVKLMCSEAAVAHVVRKSNHPQTNEEWAPTRDGE
jgi:hypothetical protein